MTIHKSYIEQNACINCKHVFGLFDYDSETDYYCYFGKEKPDMYNKFTIDKDLEVDDVGFCPRYKMNPDAFSDATKAKNAILGAIKCFEEGNARPITAADPCLKADFTKVEK